MAKDNWRTYAHRIEQMEARYVPKFTTAIHAVYQLFIQNIKQNGFTQAQADLRFRLVVSDQLLPLVQSVYKTAGLAGARLQHAELKASLKEGEKSAAFGINARWISDVLGFLKENILKAVSSMSDTVKEDILRFVSRGIENGWSVDKIVSLLEEKALVRSTARARLIVRTESVTAMNVGHQAAAKTFPYEMDKGWVAARDHRTRHSHQMVNGHKTDEEGTFNVPVYKGDTPTGEVDKMLFPGDPDAHISNRANCRCRVIYQPKRDAKGALIRRSTTTATVIPLSTPTVQNTEVYLRAIAKALRVDIEDSE